MDQSVNGCLSCEVDSASNHSTECPMNYKKVEKTWINYGWTCPVCGRGMAPWATSCPCVGITYPITWCTTENIVYTYEGVPLDVGWKL